LKIFHESIPINVAGSVKAREEYRLVRSLNKDTIPDLPDALKELMLKPIQKEQQQIIRISSSHNSNNEDKYISEEGKKKNTSRTSENIL
jgi:hypothetical protein